MTALDSLLPIPEGTSLLHIGPHKTGTTSIQSALHAARTDLAEQGVRYASRSRHDADATRFVIGMRIRRAEVEAAEALWNGVVEGLNDPRYPRRVFSSETFANASDAAAKRVVADVGRVHVVMAARSFVSLIPSQYQQLTQRGAVLDEYEPWVQAVLGQRDDISAKVFWRRHRLDDQVRRWGDLVGPENVTVLALDEGDRDFLPTAFERLLGVRPGTLVGRATKSNRSLSADEVELLRNWHLMAERAGVSKPQRRELSAPITAQLQEREGRADAPRLVLPAWAVAEANRQSAELAERLAVSGATIVGDLGALGAATVACDGRRTSAS